MIKLVEVVQSLKQSYSLREIYINPDHVVFLREDSRMKTRLNEGTHDFPEGLDTRQSFTKIQVRNGTTGSEFIVIGSPKMIEAKLNGNTKDLLHG